MMNQLNANKKAAKTYPLDQSPFFKLTTKAKLANLLRISPGALRRLSLGANYHIFSVEDKPGKQRTIEMPKPTLEKIHRRLLDLLKRIETPDYLHSGVRGRSYVTNAAAHKNNTAGTKLDLVKFFNSTKRHQIALFFRSNMSCSIDVAANLADLCSVNGHLPTGSCISTLLAFHVHADMFGRIHAIAKSHGLTMTCLVDDMFMSGTHSSKQLLHQAGHVVRQADLQWHKEEIYQAGRPLLITGVMVIAGELRLPNKRHQKLHDAFQALATASDAEQANAIIKSISGRLSEAVQVDSQLRPWAGFLKHRLATSATPPEKTVAVPVLRLSPVDHKAKNPELPGGFFGKLQ